MIEGWPVYNSIRVNSFMSKSLSRRGSVIIEKYFFIALFYVLAYSDQFKAIKENQLRGVGHQDPLWTPTHLRLSQKPKFVDGFFGSLP